MGTLTGTKGRGTRGEYRARDSDGCRGRLIDYFGPFKGGLDVGHDVFFADASDEARLAEKPGWLLHGSAEEQAAA
jgi:hypothetical protein